jgi:hypothetical protein
MLFALSLQTAAAFAGEPEEDSKQLATAAVPPIAVSPISGYFNLTFASDYLPRGITVINQGVVIQPDLGISLSLYQGTGFINNFSLTLETWNNVATDTQRAGPVGAYDGGRNLMRSRGSQ